MKRRFLSIPIVLVMVAMFGVGVGASTIIYQMNHELPSSATFQAKVVTQNIKLFATSDMIHHATALNFGAVIEGESKSQTLYFESSKVSFSNLSVSSDIDTSKATLTYASDGGNGIVFTLTGAPDFVGSLSFSVTVTN